MENVYVVGWGNGKVVGYSQDLKFATIECTNMIVVQKFAQFPVEKLIPVCGGLK